MIHWVYLYNTSFEKIANILAIKSSTTSYNEYLRLIYMSIYDNIALQIVERKLIPKQTCLLDVFCKGTLLVKVILLLIRKFLMRQPQNFPKNFWFVFWKEGMLRFLRLKNYWNLNVCGLTSYCKNLQKINIQLVC